MPTCDTLACVHARTYTHTHTEKPLSLYRQALAGYADKMNTHTHAHARLRLQSSTITQAYFDWEFPNTTGDWPPGVEKIHTPAHGLAHTHTQVSVGQMKLPFKVTAQSTAAESRPRTLHSFQIVAMRSITISGFHSSLLVNVFIFSGESWQQQLEQHRHQTGETSGHELLTNKDKCFWRWINTWAVLVTLLALFFNLLHNYFCVPVYNQVQHSEWLPGHTVWKINHIYFEHLMLFPVAPREDRFDIQSLYR